MLLVLLISVMVGATTVDIFVSGRFEQDARLADQVCLCSFWQCLQAIEHYRRLECEERKKERKILDCREMMRACRCQLAELTYTYEAHQVVGLQIQGLLLLFIFDF